MAEEQDYYGERARLVLDALREEGVEVSDLQNCLATEFMDEQYDEMVRAAEVAAGR